MAQTSIHIEPVKTGSEVHNKRQKTLDYVRPELSHLNGYWESDTQHNRLADIKARYKAATGQQLQKKATPIREGVVVIKDTTTMKDLQNLAQQLEQRFGIHCFQIAIHKDEGHVHAKQWTPNLHAHMVFDFTDTNGKSLKLHRNDLVDMQTLVSESLGMERGVASDRKHLNSLQYKLKARLEELEKMEHDTGLGAKFLAFFGVGALAGIRKDLKDALDAIKALQEDKKQTAKQHKEDIAKVQQEGKKALQEAQEYGKRMCHDAQMWEKQYNRQVEVTGTWVTACNKAEARVKELENPQQGRGMHR